MLASASAAQRPALHGVVQDSTGAAIAGANVVFTSPSTAQSTATDLDGKFTLEGSDEGTLLIRYPGFSPVTIEITPASAQTEFHVRLDPAPTNQRIVVSVAASPERVEPLPSGQFSIPSGQIDASGGLTVDEILRQAPGFSLFRRTVSLFANPTSQGASLRGMGASGASRAVVLLDGIPLNDPFGGWIYWNRVPRASLAGMQT